MYVDREELVAFKNQMTEGQIRAAKKEWAAADAEEDLREATRASVRTFPATPIVKTAATAIGGGSSATSSSEGQAEGQLATERGEWKDATFEKVVKTAGWDARTDDRFEVKAGQEGPYMGAAENADTSHWTWKEDATPVASARIAALTNRGR